ncbi:MAG: hypothetical protein ACFFCS_07915 [Candidatus Hodarchaeota archaeon]
MYQTIPVQSLEEFKIVGYFITLIFCFELYIFFLAQRIKHPKKSSILLNIFIIYFLGLTILQVFRIFIDLSVVANPNFVEVLLHANILVVVMVCIFISTQILRLFKKSGEKKVKAIYLFIIIIIGLSIANVLQILLIGNIVVGKQVLATLPYGLNLIYVLYITNYLVQKSGMKSSKVFLAFKVGFVIAGISFLLDSYDIDSLAQDMGVYLFYLRLVLPFLDVSLMVVTISSFFLPYIEDLFWLEDLIALYIINKEDGGIIYKQVFKEDPGFLEGDGEEILLGGLTGINELITEFEHAKSIEYIDKEDVKFILTQEKKILMFLIAKNFVPAMKTKLDKIKDDFLNYYSELLDFDILDRSRFLGTKAIVNQAIEFQEWLIE